MPEVFSVKNPVLKKLVAFIAINGFVPDAGNYVPVMPDGIAALVINIGQAYERLQPGMVKESTVAGSHFIGIKSKFCFVRPNEGMKTVTVRFKPGGLPFFLKYSAAELADSIVDASQLFGNNIRFLEEQIAGEEDGAIIAGYVEEYLMGRLNMKSNLNGILEKVKMIYKDPVQCNISDLRKDRVSYKCLEREFMRHVGLPPKLFIDIVRFNYSTKLLFKEPLLPFGRVGYGSGYYDQAHFIKSFKKFSGFTPKEYVSQCSLMFLDNQQRIIDQLK